MFSSYLLPLILVIAGGIAVTLSQSKQKDPYGLFHLDLNRLPDDEGDQPKTEWLNMGYWKDTDVFPTACRALALKLIQAARLQRGARVLDVGHGTGESLVILMTDEAIPRPGTVTGITSLDVHHERSKARVALLQDKTTTKVSLVHDDAVCKSHAFGHPLHPSSKERFDAILALDCAYHFNTRREFLAQSLAKLTPNGRVALSDICYVRGSVAHRLTRMLGILPQANIITREEYVQQMEEMGYVDVVVEDVTDGVMPGFGRFLKSRGLGWWVFGAGMDWYFGSGARYVIASGCHK